MSDSNSARGDIELKTVRVEIENHIAWVTLNRPDKRNAMSPEMNREMIDVLDTLEVDDRCNVVVLTGAGGNFSSGMDIKEYFRETDGKSPIVRSRAYRLAAEWQWRRLRMYPKPTIAMVAGYCFGGAVTPLVACDLALAANDAKFGLSEINWGIIPAGNVAKALISVTGTREALFYVMTGETFDGARAAKMGLVNEAVPIADLRPRTEAVAQLLMKKNPNALRQAKMAVKNVIDLDWEMADEYLRAKQDQLRALDTEEGRRKGMEQFLDEKTFRPGLETYRRSE